ncbi:MAG TPA: hypothetical protein VGU44_01645 [Gammaproteobacteria bacterium]|nr:hypothetical protein [Gammaproteobacteria bacterium]
MKQLILAAVAATFVFASAAQAATATTTDQTTTTTTMTMSDADCAKAMTNCGADQACKAALVKDHGCKAAD